jgi:hypothetical protein
MLYGRDPTLPQDLTFGVAPRREVYEDDDDYKVKLLLKLKAAYDKLRESKASQQQAYKAKYDRTHKDITFNIGDEVWVHNGLPKEGQTFKLSSRFEGPYRVIQQLDRVTYRVEDEFKNFPVHVQRLLPYYRWPDEQPEIIEP